MADNYQYPVYFECDSLIEEQIGKIEKYFRIRRKSNGGDCGPLRSVGHKTYSVAFKHQKDQQAVLKRSEHVVNDLVFTVRDSLEPCTSSPITTSTTSRDGTAPVQSPQSSPTSTLPLSGEECELQLDPYLLRYFKECPKAEKDLERELASLKARVDLLESTKQGSSSVSTPKRIVLLGKTGSGKSNLANTIFGEDVFKICHAAKSGTGKCQAETKSVNGRSITLIDTPGFFDTVKPKEDLKPEIVRCIAECAPGPHAFLILLKVERFTEQEEAVIHKICQCFSEDALKYAVIVFTHGEDLPKGEKIEDFVSKNKNLSDLVKKCGNRCHVIDNKYWKNKQQNNYRSNQFQVEELLKTIDKMVMESNGDYYSNEMLQRVEKEIQKEEERIKQSSQNMPVEEIRKQAKTRVSKRLLIQLTGITVGALLGALFGLEAMVAVAIKVMSNPTLMKLVKNPAAAAGGAATAGEVGVVVLGAFSAAAAATGGVVGGVIGHDAAEKAESLSEAAEMAYHAVIKKREDTLNQL